MVTQELLREEPKLTQFAFHRLLAWLDDGVDSGGETYIEMRRRLVAYFDRRNRPFADDLADQTFNRISKTLDQSGSIAVKPPARYCYVVARFVLLEDKQWRAPNQATVIMSEARTKRWLVVVKDSKLVSEVDSYATRLDQIGGYFLILPK